MERNITITLEKAREWYNSGNTSLKEIALQAFSKEELTGFDFTKIKTFEDALTALGYKESTKVYIRNTINDISMYSRASAAMTKLNIIRKALNLGQDLHLIKDPKDPKDCCIYYPYNPFVTKSSTYYKSEITSGEMEVIGKIKSEGEEYNVLKVVCQLIFVKGLKCNLFECRISTVEPLFSLIKSDSYISFFHILLIIIIEL